MVRVGFEPTNHKGPALEAGGFDRFPTPPRTLRPNSTKRDFYRFFLDFKLS